MSYTVPFLRSPLSVAFFLAALSPGGQLHAEVNPDEEDNSTQLGAVTVTARHVEEDAKRLPLTVNVIGREQVVQQRMNSLEDALRLTPGVDLQSYGDTSNTAIRIRGVGALNKTSRDDSSVVLYVDGMPQPVANSTLATLDLERVEVLKGPQGTLFGRNSEAGVVQVITRQPGFEPEADIRLEYGENNQILVEGAGTLPLHENLTSRFALRYQGSEHPVENLHDNQPLSEPETLVARGTFKWLPTDFTEATLSLSHQRMRDHSAAMVLRPYGSTPTMGIEPGLIDDDKDVSQAVLNVQTELDGMQFTSITGLVDSEDQAVTAMYEELLYEKLIGMAPPSADRTIDTSEQSFNQELRLSSLPGDKVFWVTGLHYFQSDRNMATSELNDTFYPSNPYNAEIDRDFEASSFALFGETTFPLTQQLSLTTGLRHTWDEKEYEDYWKADATHPDAGLVRTDKQKLTDDYTTGRIALGYQLNTDNNLYASYSRGYKSGGWSDHGSNIASGGKDEAYKAASVDAWELGWKGEALGGDLLVNTAVFLTETSKDHLYTWDPTTFAVGVENLDTRSQGVELDVQWQMFESLRLNAALTYTDAEITGVAAGSASGVEKGHRVPEAARWNTSVAVNHQHPVKLSGFSGAYLNSNLSWRYVGDRFSGPENYLELPSYQLVNARIALTMKQTEVYLWGSNLLDEEYDLYGFYYPSMMSGGPDATLGAPGEGRLLGMGVSHAF
jgi:iron complex outermembrane receptor protein